MDKQLVCKDCGKQFTWTEGEQKFFKLKGFTSEPKRCVDCRKLKKQSQQVIRHY